jgi:hypothetical protein
LFIDRREQRLQSCHIAQEFGDSVAAGPQLANGLDLLGYRCGGTLNGHCREDALQPRTKFVDSPDIYSRSCIVLQAEVSGMGGLLVTHAVLLVCTPLLYRMFILLSEPHDKYRPLITLGAYLVSSIWAGLTFVYPLLVRKNESLREAILNGYRDLSRRPAFLLMSNLVLLTAAVTLGYQLLIYRQVEFVADREALIIEGSEVNRSEIIGELASDQPRKFRLHVGRHVIALIDPNSREPFYATDVVVVPAWVGSGRLRITARSASLKKPVETLEPGKGDTR